ncbi:MAG: radical SAM family heme chaperone HemW [Lachnospiraceae bacterium]|nr:radical SAM family heme chaperone HemW [Lachnospiraceae bacterium]
MPDLGIYIHIPFCVRKCSYCDFLSFSAGEETGKDYLDALICEIREKGPQYRGYIITSVFIGGGTPSSVPSGHITKILRTVRENFEVSEDCEISMESNPGTLTEEKLKEYKKAGINRLSMGLQSASDRELSWLGRIHTFAGFLASYDLVIKSGFKNVNIDLMYGIPGQTKASWEKTLREVLGLNPRPTHISAYSLIVEEGTPFYEIYGEAAGGRENGKDPERQYPPLPSEEEERNMDKITEDILSKYGYHRYEISNYAKKGFECRHNLRYWKRGEYLGLGLGAASFTDNIRYRNTDDLSVYLRRGFRKEDYQVLSEREQMEEFMFLGLRLTEGILTDEFERVFRKPFPKRYWDVIYRYENLCFIELEDSPEGLRVRLTPKGRDISNRILSEFLFDP